MHRHRKDVGDTEDEVEAVRRHRRIDHTGRDGVQSDAGADPLGRHRVPTHPPGKRELGSHVRGASVSVSRRVTGGCFIAGQDQLDKLFGERRGRRARVRADCNRARVGAALEQRPQTRQGCDRAVVIDCDDCRPLPHDPRRRDHAVEHSVRRFDGRAHHRGTAFGRREVGNDLGIAHIDPDDSVTLLLEPLARRRPDATCRTGDRDRSHANRPNAWAFDGATRSSCGSVG